MTQCGGGSSPTAPVTTVEVPVPVAITPPPNNAPVDVPVTPPVIPPPGSASTSVNILGDTGWCGSPAMAPIARLFDCFDGDIILAGDLAYPNGTQEEFRNCFEPSFGRFKSRMRASPGNHDTSRRPAPIRISTIRRSQRSQSPRVLQLPRGRVDRADAELEHPDRQDFRAVRVCPPMMQQAPTRCTMAVLHHPFDSSSLNGPTPALRDCGS